MAQVKYDNTRLSELRGLYTALGGKQLVYTNQQSVGQYVFLIDELTNPTKIKPANPKFNNIYVKTILPIIKAFTNDFLKKAQVFSSVDSELFEYINNVVNLDIPKAKYSQDFIKIISEVCTFLEKYLQKSYTEPSHQRTALELKQFIEKHLVTQSKIGFLDTYKSIIDRPDLDTTIDSAVALGSSDDDSIDGDEDTKPTAQEAAETKSKAEEAEAKRLAEEAEKVEAAKLKAEAEAFKNVELYRKKTYQEAAVRLKAQEDQAQRKAEAKQSADEDAEANLKVLEEAEVKRKADEVIARHKALEEEIESNIKTLQQIESTKDVALAKKMGFIMGHLRTLPADKDIMCDIMINIVEKKGFLRWNTEKSFDWANCTITQYCHKVLADLQAKDKVCTPKTKNMEANHAIGLLEYVNIKDIYGSNPDIMMNKIKKLPPAIKLATEIAYIEDEFTKHHTKYSESNIKLNKKKIESAYNFIHKEMELACSDLYDGAIDSGLEHIQYCINAINHPDVMKSGATIDISAIHHN